MPLTFSQAVTAKGNAYLRTVSSGAVTEADANGLNAVVAVGAKHFGLPILGLVEPGATFSAEARKAFTAGNDGKSQAEMKPVAIVVSSAPLRVMLGFIIRMSGASDATRFFSSEADALVWLDEKLGSVAAAPR
ncbi:MAG: hypothetical protein Q8L48_07435 [Archangium sp.]|nr:hypothetical protein [Archangium sp.]